MRKHGIFIVLLADKYFNTLRGLSKGPFYTAIVVPFQLHGDNLSYASIGHTILNCALANRPVFKSGNQNIFFC